MHTNYMYNPENYSNIGKHFSMRHKTINHNNNTTIQYKEPTHEYVLLEPPEVMELDASTVSRLVH